MRWAMVRWGVRWVAWILCSTAAVASAANKVILVQGLNSELQPGQVPVRFANLYSLLLQKGYSSQDILFYSYNGGGMVGGSWAPSAYGCSATGQATTASAHLLRDMINAYRAVYPDTRFYIVGHSLGGYISFQNLGEVINGHIPAGTVGKVITVDSPLEGSNSAMGSVQNLLNYLSVTGPCALELLSSSAANEMISRSADSQARSSNTSLALGATAAGVAIATFGNDNDCIYNFSSFGGANQSFRQIVFNATPPVTIMLGNLDTNDGICGHGSYLATITGSAVIANEIPSATPPPPPPPPPSCGCSGGGWQGHPLMIDLAVTTRTPSSSFAFAFTLPEARRTQASVVDLAGRRVARLVDGPLAAGRHEVRWDGLGAEGRPAPAGVYFFVVRAGDARASRPVMKLD